MNSKSPLPSPSEWQQLQELLLPQVCQGIEGGDADGLNPWQSGPSREAKLDLCSQGEVDE
ncbi:hypothetical protein HGM15179_018035, partial [Zosterops borbonicus]